MTRNTPIRLSDWTNTFDYTLHNVNSNGDIVLEVLPTKSDLYVKAMVELLGGKVKRLYYIGQTMYVLTDIDSTVHHSFWEPDSDDDAPLDNLEDPLPLAG